ncbi:MAG: pyridoxal phosphate-dependent aminotransferase [Planctomycetota bacterium]|nr:pyridoxal phosphate-dependent aminotransferase [Planctomycetota bacterium]
MRISRRASDLATSSTLALDGRVKALIAGGADVVNMAVGEPNFPAPAAAAAAAIAKIESGHVRYTPAAGTPELRRALAEHLTATREHPFAPEHVVVCHSGKHALSGALLCLVEPGDDVLVPLPAWVSYVELIRLAGGRPVEIAPIGGARPDLAAIRAAITPATRGILLNTPNNPSGYVWTRDEVRELSALAIEHDLWILSDEIYRRLIFDDTTFTSPLAFAAELPGLAERVVIIDGASKSFAMTGYRIGFAAGPPDLIAAITRLHSQTTGSPNAVSMAAYEAVLREEPPEVEAMRAEYAARRALLLAGLTELGLEYVRPDGAFYAFPDVRPYCDERGAAGFCEDLLDEVGLALVPGDAFCLEGYVRLSYALSMERVEEALVRLGRFLESRRAAT